MWSDVYQSPTLPFFEKLFYSNQGDGDMSPCALSYASDGGAARICQRGPKRGSEATERGFPPSHGREIFKNSCMKTAFSCTLNTIIRGSLCIYILAPIPYSFSFFILFLMNLFQGNIFPFLFPFSFFFPFFFFFFLLADQQGGGGGMAPLCPPSYASAADHVRNSICS